MTQDPVVCTPDQSCKTAAELLCQHDCGSVPVVNDMNEKKVVGILTDRDICCRAAASGSDPNRTLVRDVMTERVVCCAPDDDVMEAVRLMREHQIRRVPIVDAAAKVVGMIAQADIARYCGDEVASVVESISVPSREPSEVRQAV